ncbi:hypothetical protein NQ317_005616 [Molorchus minor]|uniref:Ketimine reductase mu-crystallin n=1 Tax=Molorchus minor TaxID=1323400 RepID=A0ABQ9K7P1_9CUCU|nr:hypothetical protein NQ317_005616 [Molorchus minor]
MIFITEESVLKIIKWDETFEAVKTALLKVAKQRVVQQPRTFTGVLNSENLLLTMPGYLEDTKYGALACKLVTVWPNNVTLEKPLPTISANIALFDSENGTLKATVAGTEITKWRTAAASAVATKYLYVNKSKPCKTLAVLGCGAEGKIHAQAFHHFFEFEEIRLWNRTAARARRLAEELNQKLTVNVFKCVENNEDCVKGADVIVTTTNATSPIVKMAWVKQGAPHKRLAEAYKYIMYVAVGGGANNHHSELDEEIYRNSDVYIDHWAGAHTELSGLEKMGIQFKGEVGAVISGRHSELCRKSNYRVSESRDGNRRLCCCQVDLRFVHEEVTVFPL